MQKYIWRGKIVDKTEVNIDLQDRGYQFGDGLYEVVHMYNGNFLQLTNILIGSFEEQHKFCLTSKCQRKA
ncbi:D-alanine aminotransferase [Lacticaseibacillus paracasei subsp. paracasei CNCM I-4270]|uniref:D-alanine aminotransferase n=1 Tax=Lacticaseibacillus paracasei subsp. paracasei CNCM I-4270 TaxID=1256202 RepID=A0A8E0IE39_LACPA|nr:D-alanine aminotransferase [Lacticaseibacillus paracasei subsp. paracasei CNCM I-4270]